MLTKKPNLIIAGVNKAGTTSLFSYLSKHHEVYPSSVKETKYFLPLRYGRDIEPLEKYLSFFPNYNGQKYIIEASPGYFYGGTRIAKTMHEVLGKIKIVIVFRNPIERMFSFYKSIKRRAVLPDSMKFDDYVELCSKHTADDTFLMTSNNRKYRGIVDGFYINYLDSWYEHFGNSVKAMFFEDLKNDPGSFMSELCEWLEINPTIYKSMGFEVENRSAQYKNENIQKLAIYTNKKFEKILRNIPSVKNFIRKTYYSFNESSDSEVISEDARKHLQAIYDPYNKKLSARLSSEGYTDLPNWLVSN